MRSLESWFDEYAQSHKNPTNIAIHKIAVPTIKFSILALLFLAHPYASYGLIVFALTFYFLLSKPLFIGIFIQSALMMALIHYLQTKNIPHLKIYGGLFILAWIFQFIGHKIEGKKPSFFKDILFLLIGPAWVLKFLYQKLGLKW